MKIWRDLTSFSSWYLPFLIVPYSPIQRNETLKLSNGLLSNWSWGRLLNWKWLELIPSIPSRSKDFRKILPFFISINWPSLVGWKVMVQKIYSKMHPVPSTNTHHDLVNHGMVKNTKTWILMQSNIMEHNFSVKQKIFLACASGGTFWEVIVL